MNSDQNLSGTIGMRDWSTESRLAHPPAEGTRSDLEAKVPLPTVAAATAVSAHWGQATGGREETWRLSPSRLCRACRSAGLVSAILEDLRLELADDADGVEHVGGVALGELDVRGVHEVGGAGRFPPSR
jgi:hypothetical protein